MSQEANMNIQENEDTITQPQEVKVVEVGQNEIDRESQETFLMIWNAIRENGAIIMNVPKPLTLEDQILVLQAGLIRVHKFVSHRLHREARPVKAK